MRQIGNKKSFRNEFCRKLIHLSSIWMVVFIYITEPSVSIPFFTVLLILFSCFEYIRMGDNLLSHFINRHFSFVMRKNERVSHFEWAALTGSFYFILSILLSLIFFDKTIAITSILIMIFADTAAALIGKSIGRYRVIGTQKSVEGTIAFFMISAIILYATHLPLSLPAILCIAGIVSLIELYSTRAHVNDNLSITLGACAAIYSALYLV